MRIRHEFGTDIVNKKVYESMTKEKCEFYLPFCADCKVTFHPCTGIDNCVVTEKQKARIRYALDTREYLKDRKIKGDLKREDTIRKAIAWYKATGFPYHLTVDDAKLIGLEHAPSHKTYRLQIREGTGLPTKTEYCKRLGIKADVDKRGLVLKTLSRCEIIR